MNEIVMRDKNRPEMRFNGQLIAETQFQVDLDDEEEREFKLQVYATEGGGYVANLQYDTTCPIETPVVNYEDMDLFKDVENFFYVFEANEVMQDLDRLKRSDRELRSLTYKRIAKAYENSMFKFLDVVRNRAHKEKFGDRVVEKPHRPSILRALGLTR